MIALHFAIPLFFPAGMAFAASMDLLTMTIPNRLCLALAFGYVVIATFFGVAPRDVATNLSCGAVDSRLGVRPFLSGVDRWRRREIGGGHRRLARLGLDAEVWLDLGRLRRSVDDYNPPGTLQLLAHVARTTRLDRAAARANDWCALWDCACWGWAVCLSAERNLAKTRYRLAQRLRNLRETYRRVSSTSTFQ